MSENSDLFAGLTRAVTRMWTTATEMEDDAAGALVDLAEAAARVWVKVIED